jgi:hypothetical protein
MCFLLPWVEHRHGPVGRSCHLLRYPNQFPRHPVVDFRLARQRPSSPINCRRIYTLSSRSDDSGMCRFGDMRIRGYADARRFGVGLPRPRFHRKAMLVSYRTQFSEEFNPEFDHLCMVTDSLMPTNVPIFVSYESRSFCKSYPTSGKCPHAYGIPEGDLWSSSLSIGTEDQK